MRLLCTIGTAACLLLAAPFSCEAEQKPRCPDGRTLSGDCIDPGLSSALRRSAVAQTQPRLSYTAPPWLPAQDRGTDVTRNFHEMNNIVLPPLITRNTGVKP